MQGYKHHLTENVKATDWLYWEDCQIIIRATPLTDVHNDKQAKSKVD